MSSERKNLGTATLFVIAIMGRNEKGYVEFHADFEVGGSDETVGDAHEKAYERFLRRHPEYTRGIATSIIEIRNGETIQGLDGSFYRITLEKKEQESNGKGNKTAFNTTGEEL